MQIKDHGIPIDNLNNYSLNRGYIFRLLGIENPECFIWPLGEGLCIFKHCLFLCIFFNLVGSNLGKEEDIFYKTY